MITASIFCAMGLMVASVRLAASLVVDLWLRMTAQTRQELYPEFILRARRTHHMLVSQQFDGLLGTLTLLEECIIN